MRFDGGRIRNMHDYDCNYTRSSLGGLEARVLGLLQKGDPSRHNGAPFARKVPSLFGYLALVYRKYPITRGGARCIRYPLLSADIGDSLQNK